MSRSRVIPAELAPCGVFCGACPSFQKTCLGCASTDSNQKRQTKWGCKLRICCYDEKGLEFCGGCEDYPCQKLSKKLVDSHLGDPRFQYRRDVPENLRLLIELGEKEYLQQMIEKFTCTQCNGRVVWYHYHCLDCGIDVKPT